VQANSVLRQPSADWQPHGFYAHRPLLVAVQPLGQVDNPARLAQSVTPARCRN